MIERLARIEDLSPADSAPKGAVTLAVTGATFCLPLEGVIDVGAEKERLNKGLAKLEKDLKGLRGRVNNPKFVASAPPEVVEEARELLTEKESEATRLNAALARLAEIA